MSTLRYELIHTTNTKAFTLLDTSIHDDIHKQHEFMRQTVLADKILTNDEKAYAIRKLTKSYDRNKVMDNVAGWINGHYDEWDIKEQQLIRSGDENVILKSLENVGSANKSWFEEAKSHLTIKEEQEAFHSKLYDFNIPNNINDFNGSNNQYSDSEKLPKEFINLQINSNKIIQQQMKRKNIDNDDKQNIGDIDDDDDVYNDPNLHSKEQDDLEIPDDGF
ncbi:kinase-like domain-containing protein [Rhizophagus irregularis DAOM 181602=DAOM 197198]|nr:kinase-like domain-containing protein [Rhizophagus irregularis DAOM 181602=DAOM 197198]